MDATQTTYTRKIGFFGSIADLGVTTVTSTTNVVKHGLGMADDTACLGHTFTSGIRRLGEVWAEDIVEDSQYERELVKIDRELERLERETILDERRAELVRRKAELAKRQSQQA